MRCSSLTISKSYTYVHCTVILYHYDHIIVNGCFYYNNILFILSYISVNIFTRNIITTISYIVMRITHIIHVQETTYFYYNNNIYY